MAIMLPKLIAIKTTSYPEKGYLCYNEKGGSVILGEESVFSTLVKVEVERATSNTNYVHLRFSNSNRYWSKKANSKVIVAELKKPVEDKKDPSCTLFQPVQAADDEKGVFYLNHVPTGGRLLIDSSKTIWGVFVEVKPPADYGYLTFVDWSTLVKLPPHVAFKGDNNRFLKGESSGGHNYLEFSSGDLNDLSSGHRVTLMPDGYIRITADHWGRFWRRSPNWIWADANQSSVNNRDTHFWPVKVDDNNTIALRNAGNNQYCKRLTADGKTSMLNAASRSITKESRLVVHELVSERNIYNIVYRMEDARIYDEVPFTAGTSVLTNSDSQEAAMAVEVTYQDEKSYTFSCSLSLTAGVETKFKAGVPFIVDGAIKVSFEINTTLQWDTTTTTTTSVTASGSVSIPARTTATIEYVGTKGTCDVPYSYTQQDRSSTDGKISYTEEVDGVYTGISSYNFRFVVKSTKALD